MPTRGLGLPLCLVLRHRCPPRVARHLRPCSRRRAWLRSCHPILGVWRINPARQPRLACRPLRASAWTRRAPSIGGVIFLAESCSDDIAEHCPGSRSLRVSGMFGVNIACSTACIRPLSPRVPAPAATSARRRGRAGQPCSAVSGGRTAALRPERIWPAQALHDLALHYVA